MDGITLEKENDVYTVELEVPHCLKKVEVERFISEMTRQPIAVWFWMNMWFIFHLCSFS